MATNSDPLTCYSQTHRIVLLIDLDPLLLHQNNNNNYIKNILSISKTLFSFPPLSSSLFAFKFFFSSLPPHLSFSKLHSFLPKHSFSFNHPSSTFIFLSQILSSLPNFTFSFNPKASHLLDSITQLFHDYPWEPDSESDTTLIVPPNLILLFTPLFNSFQSLAEYFESSEKSLRIESAFCDRFSGFFENVSRRFSSRGVNCSWIGVNSNCVSENGDEIGKIRGLFEIGTRKLGWGFCSLDSILLGSALVPFGLIYPKIGVSWFSFRCCYRDVKVQLSLSILDVNGNPIEYNCCDLEILDLRVLGRGEDVNLLGGGAGCEMKKRLWNVCSDGTVKLKVTVVRKCDSFVKLRDCFSDSVLVREVLGESKKVDSSEFFADRVLELLATEFGYQGRRKSVPVWEILLSFLYREDCWALVSVDNGKGDDSCVGILKPFTVSSALLSVLEDSQLAFVFSGGNMDCLIKTDICESGHKLDQNRDLLDSQVKSDVGVKGKQKKKMTNLNSLRNLTWSSFCDMVYDQFEVDLHDVYYMMEGNKSKKLKFLKCWMKQVKKSSCCDLTLSENPKPNQIVAEEIASKLNELPQNGDQPMPPEVVSSGINTEAAMVQDDDAVLDCKSETSEVFFSNLSNRIQQGIESDVIDLVALAERLVNSSIYWLRQKVDTETIPPTNSPLKDSNACGNMIVSELMKLLLKEPKEIAAKHKGRNLSSQAFDVGPTTMITEHVVREYELQILFRMEILQSEVGRGIEDSSKQKFVKQICLLLENIQCHMEGGFFGDWNLENYVAKIIKSRYSHTLEDIVHKIYYKMDLLVFANEDEVPDFLFNSEDSSKSLNLKLYGDEMGENDVSNGHFSAENEPFCLQKNVNGKLQRVIKGDHETKLNEAIERRERAQRFSYIKSRMPALRVWAPKQKGMKSKTDHLWKNPKRKERPSTCYDKVCETPMTTNKRSSPQSIGSDDKSHMANGSQVCGSVSKALFQV